MTRIGIGLPAAVPGTDMTQIGRWAAEAEAAGFESVGVIDRLIYDNLDPLTALAAAAATTSRIELTTTVINVNWRANPVLLAKQIGSVVQLSGGRMTAGLGMGAWPADYEASEVPFAGRAAQFENALTQMERAWERSGDRPRVALAATVPAGFTRAATLALSDGWVSPLFGLELLQQGIAKVRQDWDEAGRDGRPRIITGRYFSLGANAEATAREYIRHYYGDEYLDVALADTFTDADQVKAELQRLSDAGCDDVLLYPCAGDLAQVSLLAQAL